MARKRKKRTPGCKHMQDTHAVFLSTIEALSLITAATHAVQHGYDEADEVLESAVNSLLDQCNISCEFKDSAMVLTYHPTEA